MKAFPYFKWNPADAETDDKYSAMTDAELGFYHRCLNRSWLNDGLPSDLDELARVMKVKRAYLDKIWVRVGQCFELTDTVRPRFVNKRQEEERLSALAKSANNKRVGNANAFRSRSDRVLRAYDSVSESDSQSSSLKEVQVIRKEEPSRRFEEFWEKYPRKTGRQETMGDWMSVVTTENEAQVFACLDRYLASKDVASGAVMNPGSGMKDIGWLIKCSRDGWQSDWPRGRDSPSLTAAHAKRAELVAGMQWVDQIKRSQ